MRPPNNQPTSAPDVHEPPADVAGGSHQRMVGLHMVINQAKGKCGEDRPHVFDTNRLPPADAHRCVCGQRTWKQAVADAEAAALKAHTANAASVQSNESSSATAAGSGRGAQER